MKKGVIAIIVVVVVAAAVAAGLAMQKNTKKATTASTPSSSSSGSSSNSSSNMNMNSSSNSSASTPTATNAVTIENFAFSPADITVKKGTTVTWTNKDSAQHTVTADSGSGPASKALSQGETYSFTYNTAGTFSYHCSFHSSMTGKVTVTE